MPQKEIRVRHPGGLTILTGGALAKAVAELAEAGDYCGLCDARPSSGHTIRCPLVLDALSKGHHLLEELPPIKGERQ